MPNGTLIQHYLEHNRRQSEAYCDASAVMERRQWRRRHRTTFIVFKCMDGRLNVSLMAEVALGIFEPYRTLGGAFDLGMPYFSGLVDASITRTVQFGGNVIILITYHFSKGKVERGCKGFDLDVERAIEHTAKLMRQVDYLYGDKHTVVCPIQMGIETDDEAFRLHGRNGQIFDVAAPENLTLNSADVLVRLGELFPDIRHKDNGAMLEDLLRLITGNQHHIQEVRQQQRQPVELEHTEHMLALGRGFDWLHVINRALIVGPYGYFLPQNIVTAGKILISNLEATPHPRIAPEDGILLMVSEAHRGQRDRRIAEKRAKLLYNTALEMLETEDLKPLRRYNVHKLVGTVDMETRLFTPLPQSLLLA